jgi:hypothetical protein
MSIDFAAFFAASYSQYVKESTFDLCAKRKEQ